jgi:hypothetical protein
MRIGRRWAAFGPSHRGEQRNLFGAEMAIREVRNLSLIDVYG